MGNVGQEFLEQSSSELRRLKDLADRALEQLSVANLYTSLDEDGNCIAVLMKHVGGFLYWRWSEFFDSDGENPQRQPEREFLIEEGDSSEVVRQRWERGWQALFQTLDSLREDDLLRPVLIAGGSLTVLRAIQLSHSHVAQHVGQMIFLAKHMKGCDWEPLGSASERSDSSPLLIEQEC